MAEIIPCRTDRYLARLRDHLKILADDPARRNFLAQEVEKWEERYARFIETQGASHRRGDIATEPTAFDFAETLAALGALLAGFSPRNAA